MDLHLRPRLLRVLSYVRDGDVLWDIGCDHGYLGMRALLDKNLSKLICVDQSPRVIENLKKRMALENLPPQVRQDVLQRIPDYEDKDIRHICADAASLKPEPISGTVVIAGMGAKAIIRILNEFVCKNWRPHTQLLLIPNAERQRLREALQEMQLHVQEESIQDGKRVFYLFRAFHEQQD